MPQEDGLLVSAVQQFGNNWALVAFALNKCPSLRGRIRCVRQESGLLLGQSNAVGIVEEVRPPTVKIARVEQITDLHLM